MSQSKHIIIFSHGFGVRKDDLGLFPSIIPSLGDAECIMFDYFEVDETNRTLTVRPFSEQVRLLNTVIEQARATHPEAIIDIIAHSQGCFVAAVATPLIKIRKTICIWAPLSLVVERALNRLRTTPGSVIDMEGISKYPRKDGSTTLIPAEYWRERIKAVPLDSYNQLADRTELTMIKAIQDDVLGDVDFSQLNPKAKVISLDGDHNFKGATREPLIDVVKKLTLLWKYP